MEVKYRRNIAFLEDRKITESYVRDNINANVAQRASSISGNNDKLIDKLGFVMHLSYSK